MIKRVLIIISLVLLGVMFFPLITDFTPFTQLTELSKRYVAKGPSELGSQNIVTSVVVTYRGFDTLGEVAVLFIAAGGVGFILRNKNSKIKVEKTEKRQASEILQTGSQFLFPLLIMFGVYIFTHGHLTPGGGFQGGVIVASGFILLILSNVNYKINSLVLTLIESLSGIAFVTLAILGFVLAGGFLDNRFLPLGEYGSLFSAGAIGLIYSFIGLKVGSELTGIFKSLKRGNQ